MCSLYPKVHPFLSFSSPFLAFFFFFLFSSKKKSFSSCFPYPFSLFFFFLSNLLFLHQQNVISFVQRRGIAHECVNPPLKKRRKADRDGVQVFFFFSFKILFLSSQLFTKQHKFKPK